MGSAKTWVYFVEGSKISSMQMQKDDGDVRNGSRAVKWKRGFSSAAVFGMQLSLAGTRTADVCLLFKGVRFCTNCKLSYAF